MRDGLCALNSVPSSQVVRENDNYPSEAVVASTRGEDAVGRAHYRHYQECFDLSQARTRQGRSRNALLCSGSLAPQADRDPSTAVRWCSTNNNNNNNSVSEHFPDTWAPIQEPVAGARAGELPVWSSVGARCLAGWLAGWPSDSDEPGPQRGGAARGGVSSWGASFCLRRGRLPTQFAHRTRRYMACRLCQL